MSYSFNAQQQRFDRFRFDYNELRSHEGLSRKTPASIYRCSKVEYTGQPGSIDYDLDMAVRSVKGSGELKWKGNLLYLGSILAKERVGLTQIENDRWAIYYGFLHIGFVDERTMRIERIKTRT